MASPNPRLGSKGLAVIHVASRPSRKDFWVHDNHGRNCGGFIFYLSFCVELEHNEHARNHKISRGSVSHRHRLIS